MSTQTNNISTTPFEFNYASLILEPYNKSAGSSSKLLREVINKLNDKDLPDSIRVIDRFKNRKGASTRELLHIAAPLQDSGRRCFGRIAIIKDKPPMLWKGKDIVEEILKEENRKFIDVTHYVIHFSENSDPVIMIEFNSSGPRLSDIEFYFRQVCKEYKIAKAISSSWHLDINYDDLTGRIANVFGVTVKLNVNDLKYSSKVDWHNSLQTLKDDSGFKDVRLEFFYKRVKDKKGLYEKNIKGLDFARGIIDWLKSDNNNIEHVDDLKMSYQLDNGEYADLDFLKNKTTSIVNVPLFTSTQYKPTDFKECVGQEFNSYLKDGVTNTK